MNEYPGRVGENWWGGEKHDDQEAHGFDREEKPWCLWNQEGSSS